MDDEHHSSQVRYDEAVNLLDKLLEDFRTDEFSLDDVADSYNAHTDFASGSRNWHLSGDGAIFETESVNYGVKHLNDLVKRGWLVYDSDERTYSINLESDMVQRKL